MARAEPRIPNHRTGLEAVGDLHRPGGLDKIVGRKSLESMPFAPPPLIAFESVDAQLGSLTIPPRQVS